MYYGNWLFPDQSTGKKGSFSALMLLHFFKDLNVTTIQAKEISSYHIKELSADIVQIALLAVRNLI